MVKIGWKDAATHGGPEWVPAEDAYDYCNAAPPVMHTVGFILNKTPDYVSVTDTIGPEETGSITVIPTGMIVSFEILSVKGEADGMSSC